MILILPSGCTHSSPFACRDDYMQAMELELAALGLEVYSQNFSARKLVTLEESEVLIDTTANLPECMLLLW